MSAGVLFFNISHQLLLVKPSYKDHWGIPGGVIDQYESPRSACVREVKEELGLAIPSPQFVCVEYYPNTNNGKGESLQFMFYGGILNPQDIARIKLAESEISDYKFVNIAETLTTVSEGMAKRLPSALESIRTGVPVYLEKMD